MHWQFATMKILIAIMLLTGITVSFKRATEKPITQKIAQRKTIASLKDKAGLVRNIGSKENPVYIIRYADEYLNLMVNNLPSVFQKDSLPVIFSGDMKEMNSMEDEDGQYFVVNAIKNNH